jgi:hypothetical protein
MEQQAATAEMPCRGDKIVWTSIDFRDVTKITHCLPKPIGLNEPGG